jgi:chromosome partitioning protein
MDCGPSLSQLNLNALKYADKIIVPVSCDFLSLVGVRQILKTLKHINQTLMHPIEIMGVLPTFYDRRSKINNDAVNNLKSNFKDKVLPPIRTNTARPPATARASSSTTRRATARRTTASWSNGSSNKTSTTTAAWLEQDARRQHG